MRILLVDDDTAVIQSLVALLRAQPGHEVRVAINGEKALENAAALGGLDLLITDVVMQPMDGFTLRDEMVRRFPQVRTIFITGYDLNDYPEQTQAHQLLTKPIEPAALLAAIEREGAAVRPETAMRPAAAVSRTPGVPNVVPRGPVPRAVATMPRALAAGLPRPVPGTKLASAPAARVPSTIPPPSGSAARAPEMDHGDLPVNVALDPPPASDTPAESSPADAEDSLIGQTFGAYRILSQLGNGRWGAVYAAVQISINRPVGLKVLAAARQEDPAAKARFIADARAKANVQHPSILAVYEAGEADGRIFYAHEYVDGQNLAELQASGQKIDESTVLKLLRTVSEGLAYLHTNTIPHTPLEPANVFLGHDGNPRLANLATQHTHHQLTPEQEIQTLGRMVLSVAQPVQQLSPGLRTLFSRLVQSSGPNALNAWGPVLQGIKALEPKIVPVEAAKITAADRAAIQAVEAARRQQKRSLWMTVGTMTATLAAVVWVVWFYVFRSNERMLEAQIVIPAGDYIVGADAQVVHLDAFSIDKYEVTIGQYANFLAYLERHPTADQELNHQRQPRHLSHRPADWETYYLRAKAGKPVHSVPTDLNSPVVMVTWWDAYAYAKWRGRELPTEQQWEAAARGPKGYIYPWGDQFDPKKVNSNADYNRDDPGAKAGVDGYNFWNPVDAVRGDKSPFGVVGMAGNVSEWVGPWSPDNRPVVKGGNFMSADVRLDKRSREYDASRAEEHIGFRTVSNQPSAPTK